MADLSRFVAAQDGGVFQRALVELEAGAKVGHWMWFVFPQIAGLGRSETAQYYAISDRTEAVAYCGHPVLGPRLVQASNVMLGWTDRSAAAVLGPVDALKFRSSMTLFAAVAPGERSFAAALNAFYDGPDQATLDRL